MTIGLPTPDDSIDVWGEQLNAAIGGINATALAAQAAAATNVNVSSLDANGNPVLTYTGGMATVLLSSAAGKANGVATLDAGGQVPLTQTGNVSYLSTGAAPAIHTHALADLPQVALAIDASPAIAVFNTTTSQWPTRNSITTSPTRTVIWWGDATIPTYAIAGIDLYFGPKTSGTTVSAPTPPAPPTSTPDPVTGITLTAPVVTVNGSLYNITATINAGSTARTLAYLQLAVRGPNGEQQDTGFNNNAVLTSGQTLTVTGSGTAASTGTWTVFLAYNVTGAAADSNWTNGPVATFTIAATGGGTTPPAGGSVGTRTIPLIGRSGLPWNSGVFRNAGDLTSANEFATFRNRPLDSIMYFTGRAQYTDLNWMRDDLTAWPGYRIVAMPTQPTGSQNSVGAGSQGTTFWTAYGKLLAAKGWNDGRTICRLNWEANGNWYDWAWANGGPANFIAAYKNAVNCIRLNAPKTLFNLGVTRGFAADSTVFLTGIANPLLNFFDIIGIDVYDQFPPETTQSAFDGSLNLIPGMNNVAAYCRANGKMMWLDEWGPSHRGTDGGGDNPAYFNFMFTWMNANADVLAGETFYEDVGTGGEQTWLMTGANPNGAIAYKSHWGL